MTLSEKAFPIEVSILEPFRVGGKPVPLGPDNPVAAIDGKPIIPGPSLKGALRSALERILIDRYYKLDTKWDRTYSAWQPCLAAASPSKDEIALMKDEKYGRHSCVYPDKGGSSICPVCYLLGAQGLAGFVRVPFLTASESVAELYSARIDRVTGTVSKGANRPYEFVEPPALFTGTLYVVTEDTSIGWKLGKPRTLKQDTGGDRWLESATVDVVADLLLPALKSIQYLGGYRSKGFGRVTVKISD